jgi:hypothetical protein
VAEIPSRVFNLFGTRKRNSAGLYVINLYDLGVPTAVVIDDYIPYTPIVSNTSYVSVNQGEKELWAILVEKAFAKLNGNYASIEGGNPVNSAYTFLGIGGEELLFSEVTVDQLWDKLVLAD